jgi:hypothetical protein
MGRQAYGEESNRKHDPHAEHIVDDKFEKGSDTRNWKKNLEIRIDEDLKVSETDADAVDVSEDKPVVKNAPDRKSAKEPKKKAPQSEQKKTH